MGDVAQGTEPVFEDLGEVALRLVEGLFGERPVLVAGPDALEDAAESGAELEVTDTDLVEPEEALCCCSTAGGDAALPLLTAACRILLFSSLTILSLSSLHCLSLACLSRS